MPLSSRRDFIKTGSGLLGAIALTGTSFAIHAKKPLLSFSTLGCPKWTWTEILNFAGQNGFAAIEIRGIMGEMNLVKCPEFSNKENILNSRRLAEDKQIKITGLGSSVNLHHIDAAAWQKDMDSAKQFIDLAQQLNCPYVRVFPNKLLPEEDKNSTINRISERLLLLGDYAKGSNVTVLMETHGDVVEVPVLKKIMESAAHPHTGLIWDVFNMWSVTKAPPSKVYPELKKYIKHTHLKDGKFIDGKWKYVLFGRGECPVFEAIDLLRKGGYKGYYGFEWEKVWHPDIEEPEIAMPDYALVMEKHFK